MFGIISLKIILDLLIPMTEQIWMNSLSLKEITWARTALDKPAHPHTDKISAKVNGS